MAGIEFVEVVDVGPGWNKVRASDGNVYTFRGNYNWRSNNPGNLEYGPFAISMGAIGEGAPPPGRNKGFAIFPTFEMGQHARENLQFEQPRYANLTIAQAIEKYAPRVENDTDAYINIVSSAAGVPSSTLMKDLSPEQRASFMQAQMHHEGFAPGKIMGEEGQPVPHYVVKQFNGTPLPPGEIPNGAPAPTDQRGGGYVVQPGDTLGEIAHRLGTTVEQLAAANGITNPNRINAGQSLTVPGSRGQPSGIDTQRQEQQFLRTTPPGSTRPSPATPSFGVEVKRRFTLPEHVKTAIREQSGMPPMPRPRPTGAPADTGALTPLPRPAPLQNPMAPKPPVADLITLRPGQDYRPAESERAKELRLAATSDPVKDPLDFKRASDLVANTPTDTSNYPQAGTPSPGRTAGIRIGEAALAPANTADQIGTVQMPAGATPSIAMPGNPDAAEIIKQAGQALIDPLPQGPQGRGGRRALPMPIYKPQVAPTPAPATQRPGFQPQPSEAPQTGGLFDLGKQDWIKKGIDMQPGNSLFGRLISSFNNRRIVDAIKRGNQIGLNAMGAVPGVGAVAQQMSQPATGGNSARDGLSGAEIDIAERQSRGDGDYQSLLEWAMRS